MSKKLLFSLVAVVLTLCLWQLPAYSVQDKDVFRFASAEPLTGNWDPTSHTILAQIGIENHIFDKLFAEPCGVDNPSKLIPALALSYKRVDPLTLEFKLRQGVKFHDGTPFSAKDVKATLDYYSDPQKPGFGWLPGKLTTTVVDDYTVHVKTEKPVGSLIYSLGLVSIMSAKDIASGKIKDRPNGTGPWKFVKQKGDTTILVANPDYWAGAPKLKELHWIYVPNSSVRLFGLLSGEYDVIERVESEHIGSIKENKHTAVIMAPSVENKWLIFRCQKPPFNDVRVRRAISYAIDREGIVHILGAAGRPVAAHIPPAKFGYIACPNNITYDPAKAKKLLAEAGYTDMSKFPTLEYITSTGFYPKTKEYAEYIAASLGIIGVKVKLRVLETAPWLESLYNPEAGHMIDTGWCSGTPEPDQIIRTLFHRSTKRMTFIDDKEISDSLDKEQAAVNLDERKKILQTETLPLLMEKVPALPLFTSVFIWGYRTNVKNFKGWPSNFFYLKDIEKPYGQHDVYKE